jgi:hypothetical protein
MGYDEPQVMSKYSPTKQSIMVQGPQGPPAPSLSGIRVA